MRYYDIAITNPSTGKIIQPSYFAALGLQSSYTSYVNGQTLPGALNIELDIPIAGYALPRQGSLLRIWGVSIQELSQASDLNGMDIRISAGMQKGLPLAKPQQAGLIAEGKIFQGFGNWVGIAQSLDLILMPSIGLADEPVNLIFQWKKNTSFVDAIRTTLKTAFPNVAVNIAVSPNLVLNYDMTGYFNTLNELAAFVEEVTQNIIGGDYPGVTIAPRGSQTLQVYDGTQNYGATSASNPLQIAFEDFVGQPTWIGPNTINLKLVMRGDISVGDYVKLPTTLATPFVLTSAGAAFPNAPARDKTVFQGTFVVQEVHHFGNFRQPDAASWNTTIDAASTQQ